MTEIESEHFDRIIESQATKLAYCLAWIPLVGWMFYMVFAFIGLFQIGRGRTGFYRLRNGLIAVFFLSVVPIVGLVWWAELPQAYYIVLNKITKHGYVSFNNPNGLILKKEYYRFGKSFKSVCYYYHQNNTMFRELTYLKDKLHGINSTWYENGQLMDEAFYSEDQLEGKHSGWYESGNRCFEINYVNGKAHGKSYRWHKNGQMMTETDYLEDNAEGKSTHWYENGKIRLTENFVHNRRHGLCSWFDKAGKQERTMNYVDGISQEQIDAAQKAGVPVAIEASIAGGEKMRMIFIPPGKFMMGSAEDEIIKLKRASSSSFVGDYEAPQHMVTIKQGFYLGETEVTQAQWKAIMGGDPVDFIGPKYAEEMVAWNDCVEFIKKMNANTNNGFRLPTEAEWEYACRSGTNTRFCYGDDDSELGDHAWHGFNTLYKVQRVGLKRQNNWGLFDIHGNVAEWVEDDFHESYLGAPIDGRAWIDTPRAEWRIYRGGGYIDNPRYCRSTYRLEAPTRSPYRGVGFRVAKSIVK